MKGAALSLAFLLVLAVGVLFSSKSAGSEAARDPAAPGPVNLPAGGPSPSDVEALGRVLESEVSLTDRRPYTDDERRAVAWCVRNDAERHGTSIYARESPWGEQGTSRPFSSARPGTAADLALAAEVLGEGIATDSAYGAWKYFEPAEQDEFYANGELFRSGQRPDLSRFASYKRGAQDIRDKWASEGRHQIATVGRIELWA